MLTLIILISSALCSDMDPLVWLVLATVVAAILLAISFIKKRHGGDKEEPGITVLWHQKVSL